MNSLTQVICDPKRIRHDRQRRVHRPTRWEETSVHDVKIVEIVRFAVHIERRGLQVTAKADRAVLMSDSSKWDTLTEEKVTGKQSLVALITMRRALRLCFHETFEFGYHPLVTFFVIGFVAEHDLPVATQRDAIVGIGQVFRR